MANEDKSTRYQRLRRRAAVATVLVDLLLPVGAGGVGPVPRRSADAVCRTVGTPGLLAIVCVVLALWAARTAILLAIGVRTELAPERRYRGHDRSPRPVGRRRVISGARSAAAAVPAAALVVQRAGLLSPGWWWLWVSGVLAAAVVRWRRAGAGGC